MLPDKKLPDTQCFFGATGTGKTTFEATASGFLQRFDPLMFVVDYNRSTELFVRAYGGSYFTLQEGIYTGCKRSVATGRRPGIARLAQTSRISETLDTGSGTRQPGQPLF